MGWDAIAPVALGALAALAGAGLAEVGQWVRVRRAERVALAARTVDRRAELWELSLPAASRVRDHMLWVVRAATRPPPWDLTGDELDFDEDFSDRWYAKKPELDSDIELIPSIELRGALSTVSDGIWRAWGLANKAKYAVDMQTAVRRVAQVGFEAISGWMRGEGSMDLSLAKRLDPIAEGLKEIDDPNRVQLGPWT